MTGGDIGVQLGQLVLEATMESIGEAALLTGEDLDKTLIEYLTLMQFSASRRVANLFSDAYVKAVLDDIRRPGMGLLENAGLAMDRTKLERFQNERYGQYYAAIRQDEYSHPSEVLARAFLSYCTRGPASSDRLEQGDAIGGRQAAQDIAVQLEQLDHQIDVFVLGFMGTCPHDESTSLSVQVDVRREGDPERDIIVEFIASDLCRDANDLSRLNRTFSRSASVTGAGGLAWAGYEALMGDWLSVLVIGVVLLLAGGLANRHKCLRVTRTRQKWADRFSRLNADQRSLFLSELNARHPLLLARLGL